MKKMIAVIWTAFVLLAPISARGEFAGFPIGSLDEVTHYCVTNTQQLWVDIQQAMPDGTAPTVGTTDVNLGFESESDLQSLLHQRIQDLVKRIITRGTADDPPDVQFDKDRTFRVLATALRPDPNYPLDTPMYLMVVAGVDFNLIKTDGQYAAPDLSGVSLKIVSQIPFYIPKMWWGRTEVSPDGGQTVWYNDPRYEPEPYSTGIWTYPEYFSRMYLSRDYIKSGYDLKITLVTGDGYDFQVFKNGTSTTETPMRVTCPSGDWSSITVTGGDPGRMFVVQTATSVTGPWQSIGQTNSIGIYQEPVTVPLDVKPQGQQGFFRLLKVDGVPK